MEIGMIEILQIVAISAVTSAVTTLFWWWLFNR